MENLLSQPRSRGIPVEWIGPIYDQEDLQDKYQKAAIFVYPSLAENGETFGVAPLEAMACGAVPVVSSLACFRDFIKPGRNGEVFDHRSANATFLLANHIIRLACDENQRKMLSSAAREVNISHHPAQIAKLFVDCFEGLVDGPDKKHHD
jgi:glycosyltransferase involved in cell wall biosynthesis